MGKADRLGTAVSVRAAQSSSDWARIRKGRVFQKQQEQSKILN